MADLNKVDMQMAGTIGPKNIGDSQLSNLRLGNYGDLIVSSLYGKYGELAKRGLVFVGRTTTGAAIPLNSALTNSPSLWNRASSGKLVIPLKILLSPTAIGTPVLHGLTLSYLTGAGDSIGTGAAVVTFTNVPPVSTLIGGGAAAVTQFAHGTCTYTTNPAAFLDLGAGHWLEGTAASAAQYVIDLDLESMIVMRPGTVISVGATTATSTTYTVSIVFAELPLSM